MNSMNICRECEEGERKMRKIVIQYKLLTETHYAHLFGDVRWLLSFRNFGFV